MICNGTPFKRQQKTAHILEIKYIVMPHGLRNEEILILNESLLQPANNTNHLSMLSYHLHIHG